MKRVGSIFLLFGLVASGLAGAGWYVSPDGSNGAAGTEESPFRTVNHARNTASPGDTIFVMPGTYEETVAWTTRADPASPIRLVGHGDEMPVLRAPSGGTVLYLGAATGLVVDGLAFANGTVQVSAGSADIRVENCRFEGIESGNPVLSVEGAGGVVVENCDFIDNRVQFVVSVTGDSDDLVVSGNRFIDNFNSTGDRQATVILRGNEDATGVRIEGNEFRFTEGKETRPILPLGDEPDEINASAIMIVDSDGGSLADPGIVLSGNEIVDYRFRGTNDDTDDDPTWLKTPEEGGEKCEGIEVIGSHNLRIEGNRIENISAFGVRCFLSTHLEIVGNEFLRCGANGVFLVGDEVTKTGASPVLVADNVILDGGWQKGGTSGISSLFTGPGNLILRNFVAGQTNGTVGEEGADWYGDGNGILADLDSAGTLIIGNVTVANQGAGISVNRSSDSIVLHNTAVDNGEAPHLQGNAGIYVSGETGPSDRQLIANNLLYGNKRGQVWVWRTALDHAVNHNLLAPGPLTSPGPHPFVYEVDWYGTIYTFDEWTESPPRAGIGMGSQGSRPVFLGDLLGGDPGREPLYYLPVADGPGDAAAAPRGDFAAIPAIVAAVDTFPSAGPLLEALGDGFGRVPRPAEDANIGALEWPEGDFLYEGIGPFRHETGPGEEHRLWAGPLGTWLRMTGAGLESTEFGTIDPSDTPQVFASARFGWVHHGKNPDQYAGWIWSERFAWMKFEQAGDETYLWVPMMNSWMSVNADGSFTSFQWGRLVPEGLNRYDSSVFGGLTTGDFGGWVASDRFGWMWANGDGVWFWSQDRQEWLGVTEGGGIWSTAEGRFL